MTPHHYVASQYLRSEYDYLCLLYLQEQESTQITHKYWHLLGKQVLQICHFCVIVYGDFASKMRQWRCDFPIIVHCGRDALPSSSGGHACLGFIIVPGVNMSALASGLTFRLKGAWFDFSKLSFHVYVKDHHKRCLNFKF